MVLAHILKQVRENRHFELADVATFTKISAARLSDFETGKREPSFLQIEKLADAYGLPAYLLASRQIPNLPEALPDFRRQTPEPAQLSPKGMQRVWSAEKISIFTHQLSTALEFKPAEWAKDIPRGEVSRRRAASIREFFNEWLAPRVQRFAFTGSPEQRFLGAFRLFLEAQGVVVNVDSAPGDDFIGFYLNEPQSAPLTFINRALDSRKAQLFTAVHEYAHHLLGKQGISDPFTVRNSIERECNQFAAEFLAPTQEFRSLAEDAPQALRADASRLIDYVSAQSLLSRHATAIRLVETNFVTQTQLDQWIRLFARNRLAEKQEEQEAAGSAFGYPHAKRIGEIGYLPTYLSKTAIESRLVDKIDVQAGLGLSLSLQDKAFALASRRFEIAE